jgi:hypothetical protein
MIAKANNALLQRNMVNLHWDLTCQPTPTCEPAFDQDQSSGHERMFGASRERRQLNVP